ncbi:MAG: PKD domain-containing protein [Bacteroidota bacterium]|nr:PKD domain-containing protein [Bacteroidota bacterium]
MKTTNPILILGLSLLLILLIVSANKIFNNNLFQNTNKEKEIQGKEISFEEEKPKSPDQPEKAYELEFLKTRDPKTNTVPTERLIPAMRYMKQLQQTQTDGPIAGIDWQERGPNNVGGRTRAVLFDRADATGKIVFAGGVGGGLWKTTDITQLNPNWTKIDDFFSNIAISCIIQDPQNAQVMYFGTGEGRYNIDAIRGLGIWKSTNGGNNWSQLSATNNSSFHYTQKMAIHPGNGYIFAATRSAGIMRSTDGGTSWTSVLTTGVSVQERASDVSMGADNSIYAAMGGVIWTDGIYKSTNNGNNWTKLNTAISGFPATGFGRLEIGCAPSDPQRLYVVAQNSASFGLLGIYRSIDGGTTFTQLPNPIDADPQIGPDYTRMQAWYDLPVTVDPNNADVVYVGGIDLLKSINGGLGWTQFTHWYGGFTFQDVHADQHTIVFKQGSSDIMLFGNDGGVYYTTDGTAFIPTLKSKEINYNTTQYYGCAIHPAPNTTHFLAGAQDNGSHKFTSAGINSTPEVTGGDGAFCHIDQNQPQYQWTAYVYNNYFTSTDGGESFSPVDISNDGQFINPTDYDDNANKMYCGNTPSTYIRWENPQTDVTVATYATVTVTAFGAAKVTAVKVGNTPNRVFFGLNNGKVVRVDNAHTGTSISGVDISTGLPTGYVSCVEVQSGNDNHILASYSNYGVNSVWETVNGGASWTSIEGNIPDMPVRWLSFSPLNSDQALAATELGVWSTDDLNGAATNWGPSNSGLANVSTHMLQHRNSDKTMIAVTHGRGLFSTDAFSSPAADFSTNKRVSYINKGIQFTDNSSQATSWLWNFGDGTESSQQNPVHSYNMVGTYTITLTINNGASSKTLTNHIKILPNRGTPYLPAKGGNFEVNTNDFIPDNISGTPFERGSSTITFKNGTHSPSNAWVTGLTEAQYQNATDAELYTPNYNFSAAGTYTIRFWSKFSTECAWDGFRVEATTNKGDTWNYVGTFGLNFYNYPNNVQSTVFPVNEPYFSCMQPNYTEYFTNVPLAGQPNVAFRFVFKTDLNTPDVGVAIDDFQITGPVNSSSSLSLTAFIEGFYNPSSNTMVSDTATVYIRNSSAPYAIVDSSKGILNSSGSGSFYFSNTSNGTNYYIVVKHRNSIETWSNSGNAFTADTLRYNFSSSASSAFGSNQKQIDTSPVLFGIYSGDVNQEGIVDITDLSLIDNDAFEFTTGYVRTDLTGDNFVDLTDLAIADNNAFNFVSIIRP